MGNMVLQLFETIPYEQNTILMKDIPSNCVFMMIMESAVWHMGSESPLGVQLGWDLMTAKPIACNLHTHQTIQWPLMRALDF